MLANRSGRGRGAFRARDLCSILAAIALIGACGPAAPTPRPTEGPTAGPVHVPTPAVSPTPTPGSGSPAPSGSAAPSASPAPSGSSVPNGSPSANPTGEQAAIYRQIQDQVQVIRGLTAKELRAPILLDAAGLQAFVKMKFDEENPAEAVERAERIFKALGLFPAEASLADLSLELSTSQTLGLYDSETKNLYVVSRSGVLGPIERVSFAHEFTHALQDQHFGLDELGFEQQGQSDRRLARLALVEGDATLLMALWAQQNLSPEELLGLAAAGQDPAQQAILDKMPPILRETLLFPYLAGLTSLVLPRWQTVGGWGAIDLMFGRPPDSVEQVLHAEKYDSPEAPVGVELPSSVLDRLGPGWRLTEEDTFGELQIKIWLQIASDEGVASSASQGWGGDRLGLYEGPNGAWALLWKTAWDTPTDEEEFGRAARAVIAKLTAAGGFALITPDGRSVLVSSERPTLDLLGVAAAG